MRNTNKKGFTIVELVVVVAVIAILAAVLIPTFSGIIKKANLSADQKAVTDMNTVLAMEDATDDIKNIFDMYLALEACGLDGKNYEPLTKDTFFFWDSDLNRVLHVDADNKVIAPAQYKDRTYEGNGWVSLTNKVAAKAPANFDKNSTSVTVNNANEFMFVMEQVDKGATNETLVINIPADGIDMMGASFATKMINNNITISGATGATIFNAAAVDPAEKGDGSEHNDGDYSVALFPKVGAGKTLKIENITFENIYVKNTHTSNVGILVGEAFSATVEINNVTVKNSTVIGHRNVGALIGNVNNSDAFAKIGTTAEVKLENVNVLAVGGRSGKVIGTVNGADSQITLGDVDYTGCTLGIYECEQNAGTDYKMTSGEINSWCYDFEGNKEDRTDKYDSAALWFNYTTKAFKK